MAVGLEEEEGAGGPESRVASSSGRVVTSGRMAHRAGPAVGERQWEEWGVGVIGSECGDEKVWPCQHCPCPHLGHTLSMRTHPWQYKLLCPTLEFRQPRVQQRLGGVAARIQHQHEPGCAQHICHLLTCQKEKWERFRGADEV